ncbi:hypothetical protein ACFSL4_33680 [Streptomyces caeni]|uniref:Uncharacterized protein n=1 Tax=Streptomyces caeni TaxID=2307231 RepID=A0ABW4J1A6_9ACTN
MLTEAWPVPAGGSSHASFVLLLAGPGRAHQEYGEAGVLGEGTGDRADCVVRSRLSSPWRPMTMRSQPWWRAQV